MMPYERRAMWWLLLMAASVLAAGCQPLKDERSDPSEEADPDASIADERDASSDEGTSGTRAPSANAGRNAINGGSGGTGGSGGSSGSHAEVANDGTLNCPDSVPAGAKAVSGRLEGNVNWSGAIHVTDDVTLRMSGTKLTIEAGTQIFVDPERMVEIGWNSTEHTIEAKGTEKLPIKFCRARKSGLHWKGIDIGSEVTSSSVLQYVVIEGAGGAEYPAALVLQKGILVDHVWVRESASTGVAAADFRTGSTALNVTTSELGPLVLNGPGAVERLPISSEFTGNGTDLAQVTFDDIETGVTFREIGIPYQLDRGLSLRAGGKLVVEPGVEWRVGVDQLIEFGWNSSQAELHLGGTAAKPIVIRGVDPRPGSWLGLAVQRNVLSTSTMKFVQLLHGGGNDGFGLTLDAAITASDITLKDNAHGGFAIGESGLLNGSGRFNVTGTTGVAGRVRPDALTTIPAGGSYKGNTDDWIEVDGGNITRTGTIPELDVPFRVLESVLVRNGVALTIAPGVDFQMQSGVTWDVGWNSTAATFTAVGTAAKPIKFRGILDQPGFWNGMWIGTKVATTSRLEYVHIGNGGADESLGGNLNVKSAITVSNCKLYGSSRYGMVAPMEYTQMYETLNTFEGNVMGNVQRK